MSASPTVKPVDGPQLDKHLRIGEFSRRVGVGPEAIRSWERRYQLTEPERTPGGLRLYGPADELRVRRMLSHLAEGLAAAEAARLARAEADAEIRRADAERARAQTEPWSDPRPAAAMPTPAAAPLPHPPGRGAGGPAHPPRVQSTPEPRELWEALDRFDEQRANEVFDRLLAAYSLPALGRAVILPYLRELGQRWIAHGDGVIAQEHFATAVLRGRLLALARGWGSGGGPAAVLACFPGDAHDLALILYGLALREYGWRITFLGADTPFASVNQVVDLVHPQLTVLSWTNPAAGRGAQSLEALRSLARASRVALAGAAVNPSVVEAIDSIWLTEEPFAAARRTNELL
jgi:DNA-binding transcriptional MerR regulator